MAKYIWMAVSADEYELPIATAESSGELARLLGRDPVDIRTREWRYRHKKLKDNPSNAGAKANYRVVRVEDNGDVEE